MSGNQVNSSGNGAIVAIALAVITSLTSLGTTFISSNENSKETIESLESDVKLLKNELEKLKTKVQDNDKEVIRNFDEFSVNISNTLKNYVATDLFFFLIDSLDEKTKASFYNKVNFKNIISSNYQHKAISESLKPIDEFKTAVFSNLKL